MDELQLSSWGVLATMVAATSGAIAAIASLISARATQESAKEMERSRVAQTRPLVILTTRRDANELLLVMKNFGGPAANVHVRFSEENSWAGGNDLNDAPIFRSPIPMMSPGEEFVCEFGYWPDYWYTYERGVGGGRVVTGWSCNPEDFSFRMSYRDPFTDKEYRYSGEVVSIRHHAPAAGEASGSWPRCK